MGERGKDSMTYCLGADRLLPHSMWPCKFLECPGSRGTKLHSAAARAVRRLHGYHICPALVVPSLQLVPHPLWNLYSLSPGLESRAEALLGWGMQTRMWCQVTSTASSSSLHSQAFQPCCKDPGNRAGFQEAACQKLRDSISFPTTNTQHSLEAALTTRRKAAQYLINLVD